MRPSTGLRAGRDALSATVEEDGLARWQAIPLAIGSIAGSGILFLPSAVFVEAGRNSLLVWALATAVCLPMLLMFEDMVRADPGGNGIQAFVRSGLGDTVARCVPLMFLSVVIVGLPAGALIAGRYVAQSLGTDGSVASLAAATILLAALVSNLAGARTNRWLENAGGAALVITAIVLLISAATTEHSDPSVVAPDGGHLHVLLPGVVLAFWTFIGFENLTFLSREFRDPRRDYLPVSAIALGVYGLLTALLTVAIAIHVPRGKVDETTGLLQLANTMEPRRLVVAAVTVVAFGAVLLNSVAWVWGVSRLTATSAEAAIVPPALGRRTDRGVPRRAVLLIGGLFAPVSTLLLLDPHLLLDAVAATSATFIVLYLLSIVSYIRARGLALRSLANVFLLALLAASLAQSGWRSLYGVVVLLGALATQFVQRRHVAGTLSTAPGSGRGSQ
jgi:amino acid efflux transporter